ncbi:uncharacterized protein [Elaeis guineensis]|uniref:Uncharacterized protein LOC105038117 isoform X2 n=1 Tax=Elaeis guineensis var. tenera TaxID=51953 RepID=A0A6J0PEW7_ELAGV|nr:uncharacterized protein LOC105038117 isoform X2 [Elaeis guineensis]
MASQTPIFVLDENLPIHRGKGVGGVKADVPKPTKPARHERKALQDLSKDGKPLPTGAPKGSTLKDKAVAHGHENSKNASKNSFLTDEEIKKCHEWAKEGIEHAHFTGTEQRKLQKEKDKERVRKKVDKVMSALREWTDMAYNFGLPLVDAADVSKDIGKLGLEPEVLPPRARSHLNSDIGAQAERRY